MSLTKDDKNWIKEAITESLLENNKRLMTYMNSTFATKVELKEVSAKIDNIPTVDQFNDLKDSVLGAINKHENELIIVSARLSRLEEEVAKLKQKS